MSSRDRPRYLIRALAPPRFAAGVLVTMALLSAACSDQPSSITSTQHLSTSAVALVSAPFLSVSALPSGFTLGTAANFAALGGTGVTCTSPNPPLPALTISGNVGSASVAPTTVTGFPGYTPGALPCSLSGTVQLGATAAMGDLTTAFNSLAGLTCPADAAHNLSGNLIGKSLAPGLYCMSGVVRLTGQLTLNGGANDTWIFKSGTPTTSLTPIGGSVVMAGSGSTCNVYWQVATAASFDNTRFVGNVLAGTAITFTGTHSSLAGRALAQTADVTLTGASITGCTGGNGNGGGNDKGKGHDKDKDHRGHHGKSHGDHDDHGKGHGDNDHRGDQGNDRGGHDRDQRKG